MTEAGLCIAPPPVLLLVRTAATNTYFMATWLAGQTSWLLPVRARLRLELPSRPWLRTRSHLNIALQTPSPASLEIETMPYPTEHPDESVFESMTQEYTSVSTPGPHHLAPLSPSETLASLVLKRDFRAAESLHKELTSHHVPIPHDSVYLRAALHAITARRPSRPAKARLDAFEAWLSLVPDFDEERQTFYEIRQRLFRSMDYLHLTLMYHFGLVLAAKGFAHGVAGRQVLEALSRHASPSVVAKYLRQVEGASRDYYLRKGLVPTSGLLRDQYVLAIKTVTLTGRHETALNLISVAQSRGVQIPHVVLYLIARHAPDRQKAISQIQVVCPAFVPRDTITNPVSAERGTIPAKHSADIVVLATRLRSLRNAMRSSCPPAPYTLHNFITSYRALGRTRAPTLLRSLAFRHSSRSASAWVFAEMVRHHIEHEPVRLLLVFVQHFHLVGVPLKALTSIIKKTRARHVLTSGGRRREFPPCPIPEKLWPSAHHTGLVWDTVFFLLPPAKRGELYPLLLSLVQQSKQQERGGDDENQPPEDGCVKLQLPPDTFDAVHFSPFVSWWARNNLPKAASVLQDMMNLGIRPRKVHWSMIARGHAQHGDPRVALRILDRFEDSEQEEEDNIEYGSGDTSTGSACPSDVLLGTYTNVLRGFVIAGDVEHAREVEKRLVTHGYRAGERAATDTNIALLRELEDRNECSPP